MGLANFRRLIILNAFPPAASDARTQRGRRAVVRHGELLVILVIDNYDSFVHNLARYFRRLGCETRVVRNDAATVNELRDLRPDAVVISPGPCTPNEAGVSVAAVGAFCHDTPILGVCLGHQAIVQALGGTIVRAAEPMHGRTSEITHAGEGLFTGIPSPTTVCRYHSLIAERDALPADLQITAETNDGVIMAVRHVRLPTFGVQFHPEAILSEHGYELLRNFLQVVYPDRNLAAPLGEGPVAAGDYPALRGKFPTF